MAGKQSILVVMLAVLAVTPVLSFPQSLEQGAEKGKEKCVQGENCKLPDCMCATLDTPGGLKVEDTPQFVVVSFDDAITTTNQDFYFSFQDLLNPNDCRITMTFFLSHLYTNYTAVNELHRLGHEIALHSVTHKSDVEGYWRPANKSTWLHEMDDLRQMIMKHAKIPKEDLKGWRAPFLEMGGDEMFGALEELGLKYDCTWTSQEYTNWFSQSSLWPYTLDFPSPQDSPLGRRPNKQYPGLWVLPMLDLQDNVGQPCAMLDTCLSYDTELLDNPEAVLGFLQRNFRMNYESNKAPFGLYVHYSWFYAGILNHTMARIEGYTQFLTWLGTMDDVYVVSMDRLLAWMKDPKPYKELNNIPEFKCPKHDPETNCPTHNVYYFKEEDNIPPQVQQVYMESCTKPRPKYFPWLYNPFGLEDIPITEPTD